MEVLSFDIGLRNLAAAVVSTVSQFSFPQEFKVFASEEETADEFKHRALVYFMKHGWRVMEGKLIDVSEYLNRETRVKAVKKLSLMHKAEAIHAVLDALEKDWFSDGAPNVVAVEIQHGANAEMRAVSLAIPVFFRRSMDATEFLGIVGGQKLKLCEVVGAGEGSGLAYLEELKQQRKDAKAAARKTPARKKKDTGPKHTMLRFVESVHEDASDEDEDVEVDAPELLEHPAKKAYYNPRGKMWSKKAAARPKTTGGLGIRDKYEDNKGRAMKAMAILLSAGFCMVPITLDPRLIELAKDPNVADAILQGVYVLWTKVCPRTPVRRKRKEMSMSTK